MPRRSSVGIAAPNPRPGQTAIGLISQEDEADFLLMEALNELLTVEFGSPRYEQLTKICPKTRQDRSGTGRRGGVANNVGKAPGPPRDSLSVRDSRPPPLAAGKFHTNADPCPARTNPTPS